MSAGKCGLKLYAQNNIFQKKNFKYEILNHLYFGPSFVLWGTVLGRFSQCFFLIFRRRSTMVSDIFTQPSTTATTTIKKLPMTLLTQYVKR